MAWGALCHVDVAGEQGVGEAREQPADEVDVHVGLQPFKLEQAASDKKNAIYLFDIRCKSK